MSAKPTPSDPKQIFEAALTVMRSEDTVPRSVADKVLQRTRPLRTRAEPADVQQRRALADAASALAMLWKL